jgi:hypothetical protein
MKSLFMSRNGHDKNLTKMYRNGLMFWVKEWTFKPRNGLQGRNTLGYLRSRTFYTSQRTYAYSISEKRMVCRHIDKPIEIHDSECSTILFGPMFSTFIIIFFFFSFTFWIFGFLTTKSRPLLGLCKSLLVACPWSMVLSGYSDFLHH